MSALPDRDRRRMMSRRLVGGAVALFVAALGACSQDSPLDVATAAKPAGVVSAIYRLDGGEATRLATFQTEGLSPDGTADAGGARTTMLETAADAPAITPFRTPRLHMPSTEFAALRDGPTGRVRASLRGQQQSFNLDDGRRAEISIARDPAGRLAAILVNVEGKSAALLELAYEDRRGRSRPSFSRLIAFDSTGTKPEWMLDRDLRSLGANPRVSTESLRRMLKSGAKGSIEALGRAFSPDALHAAPSAPAATNLTCWAEMRDLTAAILAEAGTLAAVGGTVVACISGTAVLCPSVVTAVAMAGLTTVWVRNAARNLEECWAEAYGPTTGFGNNNPGGGGQSTWTCVVLYWEISFDDGLTWQVIESVWVCYEGNQE